MEEQQTGAAANDLVMVAARLDMIAAELRTLRERYRHVLGNREDADVGVAIRAVNGAVAGLHKRAHEAAA